MKFKDIPPLRIMGSDKELGRKYFSFRTHRMLYEYFIVQLPILPEKQRLTELKAI
jgi:hypothetical protein